MSMKNSNDINGNPTRYLPACSSVPLPCHHVLPNIKGFGINSKQRDRNIDSILHYHLSGRSANPSPNKYFNIGSLQVEI